MTSCPKFRQICSLFETGLLSVFLFLYNMDTPLCISAYRLGAISVRIFSGKSLIHPDQQFQVILHNACSLRFQREDRMSQSQINGIQHCSGLIAFLNVFGRKAQKIDFQIPVHTIDLEDTSRSKRNDVVGAHLNTVQVH